MSDEYSDIDVLCIIMPTSKDSPIEVSSEMILENEERIKFVDIREFVEELRFILLPNLEIIATDFYVINTKYLSAWRYLQNSLDKLAYSDARGFIIGVQAAIHDLHDRYFKNLGNKKIYQKSGYSAKIAQHIIRYYEILNKYLYKESFKTIFHTKYRELLISIKRGRENRATVDYFIKFCYEQSKMIFLPSQ